MLKARETNFTDHYLDGYKPVKACKVYEGGGIGVRGVGLTI